MHHKWYYQIACILIVVPLLTSMGSCKKTGGPGPGPELIKNAWTDCDSCHILLIGSSYLAFNDADVIPILDSMAARANKPVSFEGQIKLGSRIRDHIGYDETMLKIQERSWDFIIFQGTSTYISKKKWHPYLLPYLEKFRSIIKEASPGTCIIYMMPWALEDGLTGIEGETDDYRQMQENIYTHTITAVKDLDIVTAPVGQAWYTVIKNGYQGKLYLHDRSHQDKSGAYLTAAVFYATIFLEKPPGISYSWSPGDDPDYLHHIADSIVNSRPDLWNIYKQEGALGE